MSSKSIFFVSSYTLQHWNDQTPWTTGIGGSETGHIEMAQRLAKRGHKVISYAPTGVSKYKDSFNVPWINVEEFKADAKGLYVFYRNPELMVKKPKGAKYWFVAQDVDYDTRWTPEALANVDRYLCLCNDHAKFTLGKYPDLKGKVFVSANGIRSDYLRQFLTSPAKRNYNQLFFPSSPDRGLKLLLTNWFRIREINPAAQLKVAYGFDNMDKIIELMEGKDWRSSYRRELTSLLKQDGIQFTGRLPQDQVTAIWLSTQAWSHPTDFPETSCITCMEAQALGAWPVTNELWALKENVAYGYKVSGIPQQSELTRSQWLRCLSEAFANHKEKERKEMREWALENHDWEKVVTQWEEWLKQDA